MHKPPRILIVDDNETNRDILVTRLETHGYELLQAGDGEEALAAAKQHLPDLILLDVMMPKIDGIEVTRRIKADASMPFMPIILVTAKADSKDVVEGLNAGADEYLTKPVDQTSLVARVKSVLRIKELHDTVTAQAADLASWNKTLEQRVADQITEIERIGRLKRFLAPQVAELILSSGGDEKILESHRRDISVVFCDLRGFTTFAENAEPEEVMAVLKEYHSCLGALIHKHEGTLDKYAGDGLMVLFNDPLPCPEPAIRAVRMAVEMRDEVEKLAAEMAQIRPRARLRSRHLARLRHHRAHRLRRPARLFRHRLGREPSRAAVRGSQRRTDFDRSQGLYGDRSDRRRRPVRRTQR